MGEKWGKDGLISKKNELIYKHAFDSNPKFRLNNAIEKTR